MDHGFIIHQIQQTYRMLRCTLPPPLHQNFSVSQSLALCGISAENQSVLLSRGMEINDCSEIAAWLNV
jgi:hypothetical protein